MKKTVFLLSMLFACTCVSAQNEITKIGEMGYAFYNPAYYMCPKEFYYDGNVKYLIRDYESEKDDSSYWIFDIYNDQLQKEKTVKAPLKLMEYINFDTNTNFFDTEVPLTQTLFNNDELYEWIEYVDNGTNYTGFRVMQEGDVELYSVDFGVEVSSVYFSIYIVNEKDYLVAKVRYQENGENKEPFYFYLIDSGEDTGIKYVGKVNGMKVTPTILNRNTPITVDFADGSDVSHDITVTNSNGQVVARQNVAAGQSSVTLDTSHWGNGLNIVTTKNANNETQSCKIIIK